MTIITGFQDVNTAISSVRRYVNNHYKINGDLATGHAYIPLGCLIRYYSSHSTRIEKCASRSAISSWKRSLVSRSVSRIFRAGVVVPFRPTTKGHECTSDRTSQLQSNSSGHQQPHSRVCVGIPWRGWVFPAPSGSDLATRAYFPEGSHAR